MIYINEVKVYIHNFSLLTYDDRECTVCVISSVSRRLQYTFIHRLSYVKHFQRKALCKHSLFSISSRRV